MLSRREARFAMTEYIFRPLSIGDISGHVHQADLSRERKHFRRTQTDKHAPRSRSQLVFVIPQSAGIQQLSDRKASLFRL